MDAPQLLTHALAAAQKAYAPYSNFKVGAAVLLENGETVVGNNQENSSYGLSMCAERVALNYAHATYPDVKVVAIAVASPSTNDLVTPCGACRQVIAEVAQRQGADIPIVMKTEQGSQINYISDLLPQAFSL